MKRRAVFLDRDGVLNDATIKNGKPYPPSSVEELTVPSDACTALLALRAQGYLLIGATNQPDVARGTTSRETVVAINQHLMTMLSLDDMRVCYHDDTDLCDCRKPLPGLLMQAAIEHDIDLAHSIMIGDRWKDIEAGQRAGCQTIWLQQNYEEQCPQKPADYIAKNLTDAVEWIKKNNSRIAITSSTISGLNFKGVKMKAVRDLTVKIFSDGADKKDMLEMYKNPNISGFTTNPTLMQKAGITNYEEFALDILKEIKDRSISFEVFSDDFKEMHSQALRIASWGKNVYVKIPVTNTKGESALDLIRLLAKAGVKQNVTALMTLDQVRDVVSALAEGPSAYVSVFAGRIADTGRDPLGLMTAAVEMLRPYPQLELIWASPRELLNIFQADTIGCQIITVTNDILKKLNLVGKDLHEFSLETVQMFRNDAIKAGFSLEAVTLEEVEA